MIKLAGLEIELINTGRESSFIGWLDRFFCPQSRLFRKLLQLSYNWCKDEWTF